MFLLVEPKIEYQKAITTALKWADARYAVSAVADETSAIHAFNKKRFNVVLFDRSQSELFTKLKHRSPDSKFVVTTDAEVEVKFAADYILRKPPTRIEILHCLNTIKTTEPKRPKVVEPAVRRAYVSTPIDDSITIQTALADDPDGLFGIQVRKDASIAEVMFQLAKERCVAFKLIRAGREISFDDDTRVQQDDFLIINDITPRKS
jgi:hypothetical protein